MAKYYKSDYARNKKSKSIIYHYSDGTEFELTMENYLAENPSLTEEDFLELKTISDEWMRIEKNADRKQERTIKKQKNKVEDEGIAPSHEDNLIVQEEKKKIRTITKQLLSSGKLTKTQERRFTAYFSEGKSYRQIAEQENVHYTAIRQSILWSIKKLKKLYSK